MVTTKRPSWWVSIITIYCLFSLKFSLLLQQYFIQIAVIVIEVIEQENNILHNVLRMKWNILSDVNALYLVLTTFFFFSQLYGRPQSFPSLSDVLNGNVVKSLVCNAMYAVKKKKKIIKDKWEFSRISCFRDLVTITFNFSVVKELWYGLKRTIHGRNRTYRICSHYAKSLGTAHADMFILNVTDTCIFKIFQWNP